MRLIAEIALVGAGKEVLGARLHHAAVEGEDDRRVRGVVENELPAVAAGRQHRILPAALAWRKSPTCWRTWARRTCA